MNKVYKSIWNTVSRSWTAVSEAQRAKGKSSKKVAVTLALLGLNVFCASQSLAYTWVEFFSPFNLTGTKGIGQGGSLHTYDDLTVGGFTPTKAGVLYLIDKEDGSYVTLDITGNSSQLFSQSYGPNFKSSK